jgi:hypothetical protein
MYHMLAHRDQGDDAMRKAYAKRPANEWPFFGYERIVVNSASRWVDLTVGDRRMV